MQPTHFTLSVMALSLALIGQAQADTPVTNYQYDANGNIVSESNSLGETTGYAYDRLDRISRIDQPMRDSDGRTNFRFTRVETHGYPQMGWTLGVIDTDLPTLFRFETHAWPAKNP